MNDRININMYTYIYIYIYIYTHTYTYTYTHKLRSSLSCAPRPRLPGVLSTCTYMHPYIHYIRYIHYIHYIHYMHSACTHPPLRLALLTEGGLRAGAAFVVVSSSLVVVR